MPEEEQQKALAENLSAFKTFQVHFGVSRFNLEWLHCLH